MKFPSHQRPRAFLAAVLVLFAGSVVAQSHGPAHGEAARAPSADVRGLIVQLRDAPSHVEMARDRAQAREGGAAGTLSLSAREGLRWQRLLSDLRGDAALVRELPLLAQVATRDPVGGRAQLLRFAQPLSAAQAERIASVLAARPEVEWVAANAREHRQSVAASPPTDPYFPGFAGQWWLQPVQGSNANAIVARLRGVPGFLTGWTTGTTGSASAVVAVLDTGITCHPDLGNMTADCIGGAILPGYDFVSDSGYANDGDGRDADPRDPGDWVSQADKAADPGRYAGCEVEDSSWHGTIVAGMLAAQTDNGIGGAAMNWNGRVLPVRVAGKCGADVADIVEGMRWAAGLPACKSSDGAGNCTAFAPLNPYPARIINISFGGSAVCGTAYQQAIDDVRAAPGGGAVVVAAAGNGWGAPSRPASCQRVIGVAALNRDGFKTNYSNFGSMLALATVGGDDGDGAWGIPLGANSLADSGVLTLGNDGLTSPGAGAYFYNFGTSFSAPVVSGAVSLMLSLNPALTVDQIMAGLKVSARPHVTSTVPGFGVCSDANPGRCLCTTSTCGAGILDIDQALRYAASPPGYVAPTLQAAVLDTPELRAAVASGPDRPANSPPLPTAAGGGGAMNAPWLLLLAIAAWALRGLRLNAARKPRHRARSLRQLPRR